MRGEDLRRTGYDHRVSYVRELIIKVVTWAHGLRHGQYEDTVIPS